MKTMLVIGAGAMGCLFAARAAEVGVVTTVVDVDPVRLALINDEGIMLTDDAGTRPVAVRAVTAAAATGPFDLALLFTKGMHSASAVRSVAHLADKVGTALTLQNGLGNAELLTEAFSADAVLLGTALVPADLDSPNGVTSHGSGHVVLGGATRAAHQRAADVADLLSKAGFEARADPDILVAVWEKVAFNAALNPVGALCDVTNAHLASPAGRDIIMAVVAETVAVAHAKGIGVSAARILDSIDHALRSHRGHKASMLQDRRARRASEIDSINGAIVREGLTTGTATPVLSTLVNLMKIVDASHAASR